MSENIIEIKNITKIYKMYKKPSDRVKEALNLTKKKLHKEFYALDNVSFNIKKGESIGIVGKNGSGKSTLLKILTGVLTPNEGECNVHGRIAALLELGAGFNNEYTGIENIYLNGTINGFTKEQMDEKLDDIVKFADIGEHIYQPVKTYSSGMFVRLAFAVAISVDPDILIVDEALAVGDVRFQLKCMDKFMEFKNKGITIIFVSHDTNMIKRFCDRCVWLNEGKLLDDGDTDTITDRYLDFLKMLDVKQNVLDKENSEEQQQEQEIEKTMVSDEKIDIAEIKSVTFLDRSGKKVENVKHGEILNAKIEYYVNDTTITNPVIGMSILRIDNLYICGVNTLLDKVKIPWKKGLNTIVLQYNSFNLVGGSYYVDVAIFDQTATAPIDYRTRYKEFFVEMEYIAEGITVLNHNWVVD
jgi:ABC-type polysaccharide/polyol phosphate transport system ATPase subunit